jgi:FlaA1/EpsC-like NDP-sugar epimerase
LAALRPQVARRRKGRYGWRPALPLGGGDGDMIRLSTFTPRMWLILAHDLLVTAAAVLASFFIRFEAGLAEHWRPLAVLLPPFLLYSGLVYVFVGLYKAKWRFTSLPDLYNIVRAATVLAVTLLVLDYVLLGAEFVRHLLLRQDHDHPLLAAADRVSKRSTHRLSLLPLHPHAASRQGQ